MSSLDSIKGEIKKLYNIHPHIHVNVSMTNPKMSLKNEPVTIKGVYPHIFQIEEHSSGFPKRYTFQYTDVLIKQVEIVELGTNPLAN